jgi:hypothetical protein
MVRKLIKERKAGTGKNWKLTALTEKSVQRIRIQPRGEAALAFLYARVSGESSERSATSWGANLPGRGKDLPAAPARASVRHMHVFLEILVVISMKQHPFFKAFVMDLLQGYRWTGYILGKVLPGTLHATGNNFHGQLV